MTDILSLFEDGQIPCGFVNDRGRQVPLATYGEPDSSFRPVNGWPPSSFWNYAGSAWSAGGYYGMRTPYTGPMNATAGGIVPDTYTDFTADFDPLPSGHDPADYNWWDNDRSWVVSYWYESLPAEEPVGWEWVVHASVAGNTPRFWLTWTHNSVGRYAMINASANSADHVFHEYSVALPGGSLTAEDVRSVATFEMSFTVTGGLYWGDVAYSALRPIYAKAVPPVGLPPRRIHPRDDGLAGSSTPRRVPGGQSEQGSNRTVGGYL